FLAAFSILFSCPIYGEHYTGVGSQIYLTIEAKALELDLQRLFVEVSITAKPFFERMGFSVLYQQEVACRGETFVNYVMEKLL
ncbi:GNAT family N-acetyltransferase, partial [Tumidithrix elongata RA019]|nr:GNAT family N-acetyltransferase [Tumidithrix elongata RA019]